MSRFRRQFPHSRHVVLPVIHVEDLQQTLRNADLARSAGCRGVILINHWISADELEEMAEALAHRLIRVFGSAGSPP